MPLINLIQFPTVALLLATLVNAWWILDPTSLVQERLGPIVSPGQVSGHVHNISSASNLDQYPRTTLSIPAIAHLIRFKVCLWCFLRENEDLIADISAYWAP